jgi:Tfp pilus assembly protein PilV
VAQLLLWRSGVRAESGISLIDAMIATALLVTALVVLAQVLTTAVTSNIAAGKDTAAIVLASQKIEELRSSPSLPPAGTDSVDQWGMVVGTGPNPVRGVMFVRRWTIDPLAANVLGTYIIQVDVETPGRTGTTLIAATRWR